MGSNLAYRMTDLPVKSPRPASRETLYSYLARLAAVWKTSAPELAYDMGAPFKGLLEQDEEALDALATWAKLDSHEFAEILSWTGIRVGNVRTKFRGEVYVSRALRNPIVRGCPVCLREDATGADGPGSASMVMRGHWQMRATALCVMHGHPIVPLWEAKAPAQRLDFGARLNEIEAQILAGSFDQPIKPVSAYDRWLDRRVAEGTDETWLQTVSVFAVTTFCRLLGSLLLPIEYNSTDIHQNEPHSTGFNVVVQGIDAIRISLDQIALKAYEEKLGYSTAFGKLFENLSVAYADDPNFEVFQDLLRECILDHWPAAPGEQLIGRVISERRNHSLASAAQEIGVSPSVIETFFLSEGAITEENSHLGHRRLFNANKYAELLAEIPTLVGSVEMRNAMGATKREFAVLRSEGFLSPRVSDRKIRKPWRVSDGIAFVNELSADAAFVAEEDNSWETLLQSCQRNAFAFAAIISAIREMKLTIGKRDGVDGFHGIVVSKEEVDLLANSHHSIRTKGLKEISGTMSVAEFGKSIGVYDSVALLALIEAGYASAKLTMNPRTGRSHYRMGPKDMAAFHKRFVTLSTLSEETGEHLNSLRRVFKLSKLTPFSPEGQNFGPVYLRDDVAESIGKGRASSR